MRRRRTCGAGCAWCRGNRLASRTRAETSAREELARDPYEDDLEQASAAWERERQDV